MTISMKSTMMVGAGLIYFTSFYKVNFLQSFVDPNQINLVAKPF